jgi:hypothetical protein
MSLAIVLVCLGLYLGLAVVIGRFCGINSAWERVVEDAMRNEASSREATPEEIEARQLEEAERILRQTSIQSEEKDPATQLV